MTGLAIKLNLNGDAQKTIKQIVRAGGLQADPKLIRTPHVTIGYLEELEDPEEAKRVAEIATQFIDAYLNTMTLKFEVNSCKVMFGPHTVLIPTKPAMVDLRRLNLALEEELNRKGYNLNEATMNPNYTPHLTLLRKTVVPKHLRLMNDSIDRFKFKGKGGCLCFSLETSSYTVH